MYNLLNESTNEIISIHIGNSARSAFIKKNLQECIFNALTPSGIVDRARAYFGSVDWSGLTKYDIKVALCYESTFFCSAGRYYLLVQMSNVGSYWTDAHQQAIKETIEQKMLSSQYGSLLALPCDFFKFLDYQTPYCASRDVVDARLFSKENILAIIFDSKNQLNQFLTDKDYKAEGNHCIIL